MIEIYDEVGLDPELLVQLEKTIEFLLEHEGKKGNISLLITNDEHIHALNLEFRGIDRPTDVLSFPAEREGVTALDGFFGDIALSAAAAIRQAEEYGHSHTREFCFLAVHGALHLLGYDHLDQEEATVMFAVQDEILKLLKVERS